MPGFFRSFRSLETLRNLASPVTTGSACQDTFDCPHDNARNRPQYSPDDTWARKSISLDIADRGIGLLIEEIKLRGVLEPLVLLPWRPNYDIIEAKRFVHRIFGQEYATKMSEIQREIKIADVFVIVSALKWVWARIPGGIVTWDVYELFKAGEADAGNPQIAFKTIIPVVADSPARSRIIFNFFDLLSAIAAHWKTSGMGGRKIARLAAWWAFHLSEELAYIAADSDNGKSAARSPQTLPTFSEGYKIWSRAADASAHLFFGYLRSQSAAPTATLTWPVALSTLLSSTPYPPTISNAFSSTEALLLSAFVTGYSITPRHILERFHGLARSNPNVGDVSADDTAVEAYLYAASSTADGVDSFLTDEFKRILNDVCSHMPESEETSSTAPMTHIKPINSNVSIVSGRTGDSNKASIRSTRSLCAEEWAHFRDCGFWIDAIPESSNLEHVPSERQPRTRNHSGSSECSTASSTGPETPVASNSWSQFASRGFPTGSSPMVSNPEHSLPSVESLVRAPTRHRLKPQPPRTVDTEANAIEQPLEISKFPLDDAFWWAWLCAHGPEELSSRRLIFATHVVVEFDAAASEISNGLSDLKKKDRLVIFEERLSTSAKRGLDQPVSQGGRNSLRRLASRSFKFLNRSEPAVVVAKAAVSVKLRDRPSLLSLYREYQSSNSAPGAMTVNVVRPRSPGAERVKRLQEAVQAAGTKPDEEAGIRTERSRDQSAHPEEEIQLYDDTRWKHHVSMVIEVDEEISKAVQWANSERREPTPYRQLAKPDRMLPTPPLSPQAHRSSTAISVADVLRETSCPSPKISVLRKGRAPVTHKRKKLTLKGGVRLRRGGREPNNAVNTASIAANDEKNFGYRRVKTFMAKFMGRSGTKHVRTPSTESEVRHYPRGTSAVDAAQVRQKSAEWKQHTRKELLSPLVSGSETGEISANVSTKPESKVESSLPTSLADLQLTESSAASKTRLAIPKSQQTEDTLDFEIQKVEPRSSNLLPVQEGAPLEKCSAMIPGGSPAPRPGVAKRIQPMSPPMRSQPQFPDSPTMIQPIFPSAPSGLMLQPPYSGGRSPSALRFPLPPAPHMDAPQVQRTSQLMVPAIPPGSDMAETRGVGSSVSQHMRYPQGPSASVAIPSRTAPSENPQASSRWATITADARDRARSRQYQQQYQHMPVRIRPRQQPPLPRRNGMSTSSYATSGFVPMAELP
ncbi:hypothetical protein V1509DRAFT_613912 [Lipomyces kononenkoae]